MPALANRTCFPSSWPEGVMERQRIDDEHIVARYLAGQLSEADATEFEAHYAQDPAVVRDIERTLRLKEGLAILSERGQLDALLRTRRPMWQPALALAAGLAVLVVGVLLWAGGTTLRPIGSTLTALAKHEGSPLRVANTYVLARTRSASTDIPIALPRDASAIELRMIPSARPKSGGFRIVLSQIDAANATAPLGDTNAVASSDDGFVTVYLDSTKLVRGRYVIELQPEHPEGPGTPADRFILDVR
jgi:hypothetical protein